MLSDCRSLSRQKYDLKCFETVRSTTNSTPIVTGSLLPNEYIQEGVHVYSPTYVPSLGRSLLSLCLSSSPSLSLTHPLSLSLTLLVSGATYGHITMPTSNCQTVCHFFFLLFYVKVASFNRTRHIIHNSCILLCHVARNVSSEIESKVSSTVLTNKDSHLGIQSHSTRYDIANLLGHLRHSTAVVLVDEPLSIDVKVVKGKASLCNLASLSHGEGVDSLVGNSTWDTILIASEQTNVVLIHNTGGVVLHEDHKVVFDLIEGSTHITRSCGQENSVASVQRAHVFRLKCLKCGVPLLECLKHSLGLRLSELAGGCAV